MQTLVNQAKALKISLDAGEINIHSFRMLLNKILESASHSKTTKATRGDELLLKHLKKITCKR